MLIGLLAYGEYRWKICPVVHRNLPVPCDFSTASLSWWRKGVMPVRPHCMGSGWRL